MKKRIAMVLVVLCLAALLDPLVSYAEVRPGFIAINDTLLPFTDENMPFFSGGEVLIPCKVLEPLGMWSIGSDEEERMLLFRGAGRYLDFYTKPGETRTLDQDGNTLNWPAARRVGRRFYVPLRQVCAYFDLTFNILEISRDIIPQQQMILIRIVTNANFNDPTFIGLNRNALRNAYNDYFTTTAPPPDTTPPPGETPPPEEEEPPPPVYTDVSILLSFFDISAGSIEPILDLLDNEVAFGYRSCFFVSADDIMGDQGLIRRIYGSGHSIGIRLTEGTYEEYTETSAMLFEASKIRTILVSIDGEVSDRTAGAGMDGLIYWGSSLEPGFYDDLPASDINAMIPTTSGERYSLMFPCSEDAALVLPGVISFLRQYEYTIEKITETAEVVTHSFEEEAED